MPIRGFQWDLARQTERLDWLIAQLPRYADWGYQELYLHLEDAVEYPSLPGVARRGAYSRRDFARLVSGADRAGLKVVPIVNLLGHTQYLIKVPRLRELNELVDSGGRPLEHGQICPLHPRTREVMEKLLRDIAPFCTAGKVHAGLDESYHLGRHPLSRAEIAEAGMAGHFARHVGTIHGIAAGMGLRVGMWADMLALLPAAIPLLPADVIAYDWYYYPFRRLPRVEIRNFAECDLEPALRSRGIEYWGCPMSGAFRHEPLPVCRERVANISAWWRRCLRTGAAGMLVTSWEPGRLPRRSRKRSMPPPQDSGSTGRPASTGCSMEDAGGSLAPGLVRPPSPPSAGRTTSPFRVMAAGGSKGGGTPWRAMAGRSAGRRKRGSAGGSPPARGFHTRWAQACDTDPILRRGTNSCARPGGEFGGCGLRWRKGRKERRGRSFPGSTAMRRDSPASLPAEVRRREPCGAARGTLVPRDRTSERWPRTQPGCMPGAHGCGGASAGRPSPGSPRPWWERGSS